jgi:hypothetical protein
VAWPNFPPAEGAAATVLNAIANLDRVRAEAALALVEGKGLPAWGRLVPAVR